MRPTFLAVAAAVLAAGASACATRTEPYRFASPLLGTADVPAQRLGWGPHGAPPPASSTRELVAHHRDERPGIRVTTAPPIREASAAAAIAITAAPAAREEHRDRLAAPQRLPAGTPLPGVRAPLDLRALAGRRDPREPIAATMAIARGLETTSRAANLDALDAATGPGLVAWAERNGRLRAATDLAAPGDLLVFDHAEGDAAADRLAIVIGRDARGVTEMLFLGGGIWRRGFLDASRPSLRRDESGATVNTFLRTNRRWPPKGTRFLAGELLAHVVSLR